MGPCFLTLSDVLDIHRDQIERYGGASGIRDVGLLESALGMPMAGFGGNYLHSDLFEMAAAYLFHICKNHAFVDGNKRTALASAEIFVRLNNQRLNATDEELENLTRGVADGSISKEETTEFFHSCHSSM